MPTKHPKPENRHYELNSETYREVLTNAQHLKLPGSDYNRNVRLSTLVLYVGYSKCTIVKLIKDNLIPEIREGREYIVPFHYAKIIYEVAHSNLRVRKNSLRECLKYRATNWAKPRLRVVQEDPHYNQGNAEPQLANSAKAVVENPLPRKVLPEAIRRRLKRLNPYPAPTSASRGRPV